MNMLRNKEAANTSSLAADSGVFKDAANATNAVL